MSLEQRILERVEREFSPSERDSVVQLLNGYSGPETGRVTWDILELSRGSLDNVRRYSLAAQTDYRDVLYWADYYENDPLLHQRDPRQLVDEIIEKWGDKEKDGK